MNNKIRSCSVAGMMLLAVLVTSAGLVDAQRRNDREVRDSLRSLNSKIDDLENDLGYRMRSTSAPNGQVSDVMNDIRALRDATRDFEENVNQHRENRDDVTRIIEAARPVGDFLRVDQQNRRVDDDWVEIKRQIERLGGDYGITANWTADDTDHPYPIDQQPNPLPKGPQTRNVGLSGTYELDRARSENIDDIISGTNLGTDQREDLKDKLEAPQQISIDIRGDQVVLSTSNASAITFTADGRDKTETNASGKTVRVRATLSGQNLVVSSLGGETDYTITFTSLSNGQAMKVQRRITTDYMNQTVIAESVYNKTDSVAQSAGGNATTVPVDPNGGYSDNDNSGNVANGGSPNNPNPRSYPGSPRAINPPPGNYTVPNGTILTGRLENEINTAVSQNNDRFRLTVQSPADFRGAVIEGYISGVGRSGRVSGQSNVTFNFERITLRNGQSYDFAGYLQGITDQSGKVVRIDNEGTVRGDNQTRQTVKRGGIGGGIGAVIGAIAGGAKGAAIGAVIGSGAGAGSVYAQGKDDIRLLPGSTVTVQSSSPNQNSPR